MQLDRIKYELVDGVYITSNARLWLTDEGILWTEFTTDGCELEEAKHNVEVAKIAAKGEKRPMLVDITKLSFLKTNVGDYYSREESYSHAIAGALIVGNLASKMIGQFYMSIHKPAAPMGIFTSKEKAIEWLKAFL